MSVGGDNDGDGLIILDKPSGPSSHDVVAQVRKIAQTRKVGHAGTLDPMATGVLVLGVGRATRMLGHLVLTEKAYTGTIRLGVSTDSDDAQGSVTGGADASAVSESQVREAVGAFVGQFLQVPSTVSAVKVDGRRAYDLARSGEQVELAPRAVSVRTFEILHCRREGEVLDVDVSVVCSSGTYVRALARDLGAALGTGGHLTALRRTRVGPFGIDAAVTLEQLAEHFVLMPLGQAAHAAFPVRQLSAGEAELLSHGVKLPVAAGAAGRNPGPVAALAPDGSLIALLDESGGQARPLVVFRGPATGLPARPAGDRATGRRDTPESLT